MSAVHVNPYSSTHTVAHVMTKMLNFLKEIIRESGLDPSHLMDEWESLELAINTWLNSRHLNTVILEIYDPKTDLLVKPRWDLDIIYDYGGDALWADGNAIRYHIKKAGLVPSSCKYRFVCDNKDGRPDVSGWSKTKLRSIEGLKKYSIGTAIGGTNIGTGAGYWR
jgi:hypothetical protein